MKRGAYLAAIGRAKYVVEHLPNTPQTPYALSILIEAYKMLDYDELKDRSLEVLLLNYPEFNLKENESINNRSWTNILSLGLIGKEAIQRPDEISP